MEADIYLLADVHKREDSFSPCLLAFVQEKFKEEYWGLNFGCLSDMLHYLLAYDTTLNLQVSTSMLITLECEFLLL